MTNEERAKALVFDAVKDFDEGGYSFASIEEMMVNRIGFWLNDAEERGRLKGLEEARNVLLLKADKYKESADKMMQGGLWANAGDVGRYSSYASALVAFDADLRALADAREVPHE
jgi:hypothetical protein